MQKTTRPRRRALVIGAAVLALVLVGTLLATWETLPWVRAQREVILATTTSTRDSGLLDVLIPMFERESRYIIKTVAVGSGAAMELGRRGEADLLLTHAPAAERQLVAEGVVSVRRLIMHNDFVVVGPPGDPAGLRELGSVREAFGRIATAQARFVSRGDDSGTHKMEMQIWQAAALTPSGQWYIESGTGMGDTLRIASEKGAYTLTDRGTFLNLRATLELEVAFEGDPTLLNLYHVMELNPERFRGLNVRGARAFADFLLSAEAQAAIAIYGVDRFGSPLFFPDGGKTEEQVMGTTR